MLIRQLQDQHYEQYMRQIYQQQLFTEQNPTSPANEVNLTKNPIPHPNNNSAAAPSANSTAEITLSSTIDEPVESEKDGSSSDHEDSSSVAAASMWTRKDLKEFKESVKAEGGEAIIRIGQGESVTVRKINFV